MATALAPHDAGLVELAAACVDDPLRFVLTAYPWGEPGTLLADEAGPDAWQADVLEAIRAHLQGPGGALRMAVVSGHGVGKSCLTAWLVAWYLATRPHPQVVVTANTATQLASKTWRELAKWHQLSLWQSWFTWSATKYAYTAHAATWFASAIPWRQDRPEAFAGTHEAHVLILMDEASAIPDVIWETAEGAMTTPGAMWLAFGNGTRSTGRFRTCFPGGPFAHRWQTYQVDSRQAKKADQTQIAAWIADYGEDSDFVRVRVKGQFPRVSSTQFLGEDLIALARARQPAPDEGAPIVIGVDVARFGDDRSCLVVRQGGLLLTTRVFRELDTVQVAGHVLAAIAEFEPQAVFVDADGLGAGVADHVRAMGPRQRVHDVHSGARPTDPQLYHNKRAEMWARCREWVRDRGVLGAEHGELVADLLAIEYGYDMGGKFQMEDKKHLKARTGLSPDLGDALVYTFAEPVARRQAPAPAQPQALIHRPGLGWMGS